MEVGRIEKLSDGGPAFPPQDRVLITQARIDAEEAKRLKDALAHAQQTGMTLRDFFAAHALLTMAHVPFRMLAKSEQPDIDLSYDYMAENAYALADAMLKARAAK